jgi:hypothetical protein
MAEPNLKLPELASQDIKRFWTKIALDESDQCWLWTGARDEDGYGLFKVKRKMCRASRIMYFLHYGEQPSLKLVCHTCDNPPCMNPSHFFLGTSRDNKADSKNKGRLNIAIGNNNGSRTRPENLQRGDNHWTHRRPDIWKSRPRGTALTPNSVIMIRQAYANGQASIEELARVHGVCTGTIYKAVSRITWKHI